MKFITLPLKIVFWYPIKLVYWTLKWLTLGLGIIVMATCRLTGIPLWLSIPATGLAYFAIPALFMVGVFGVGGLIVNGAVANASESFVTENGGSCSRSDHTSKEYNEFTESVIDVTDFISFYSDCEYSVGFKGYVSTKTNGIINL